MARSGSDECKTTLLSWVTVFEVLNFQQRRVLGHHIDVGMASPLTYGRDNITPLQASIHAMLDIPEHLGPRRSSSTETGPTN